MYPYPKPGHPSRIRGYEIGPDYIDVLFPGDIVYRYSYTSAGKIHIDEMKKRAKAGEGLLRYINANVYSDYESKGPYIIPVKETSSIAPMPNKLRKFDVVPYLPNYRGSDRIHVYYSENVDDNDKIPGLIDFIKIETGVILEYMPEVAGNNPRFPEIINIELSPYKVKRQYGSLTDTQITDRISELVNLNPPLRPAEVVEMIKDLMRERIGTDTLTGVYCMQPEHIEIYYRVLNHANGLDGYLAAIREVLSHELCHMGHCHSMINEHFNNPAFFAGNVKEAIADFFSFIYCLDASSNIWPGAVALYSHSCAQERYNEWQNRFGSSWPYANSLHFTHCIGKPMMPYSDDPKDYTSYGCISKYREVWSVSRNDFKGAYDGLLNW